MEFINFFFYVWTFIAIWYEIWMMKRQNYNDVKKLFDKDFNKIDIKADLTSSQIIFVFLMIGYFFWNIVGFLSSQWIFFLFLFALSMLNGLLTKLFKKHFYANIIDSILTIVLLFSMLINKYHLHYSGKQILNYIFGVK